MLIKACLNGARQPGAHPALPCTAEDLARDAAAVVGAGAGAVHVHPRGPDGRQSLAPEAIGAAVTAIRAQCPGVPVGVTTIAGIQPTAERRLAVVGAWAMLPDFASVNLSEEGAAELAALLLAKGVGVEAGVWSVADAERLGEAGLAGRCTRILIELVRERTVDEALAAAAAIERTLDVVDTVSPRLLHGAGETAWPLLDYAITRGYDVRIGLEDTFTLPDGRPARDNAELVAEARGRA